MILQQRQLLNDNDLHTLLFKGEIGMHILDALSVANIHSPDPQIKDHLIKTAIEQYKSDSELPKLLNRYDVTLATLQSDSLNVKQYISLYAVIMKTKIKEYYTNSKYQLFCNVYVPSKYTRTLNIFCHTQTLTGYISLVTTNQMTTLMAMEEMIGQIDQQYNDNFYAFDQIFDDVTNPYINATPEKESSNKFVRRHKKSLSEHQIFDFQRDQKQIQENTPELPSVLEDKALFFSQTKQNPINQEDDYQFPASDSITKQQQFSNEVTKLVNQYQQNQEKNNNFQKVDETINVDDFEFFPPIELANASNGPQNKLQSTDQKKTPQNPIYTGRLKFFDEQKNYGFIVMDDDKSDIFVHLDDLQKAGVSKELLKTAKQGSLIRFQFNCMVYVGKYKKSRKAVELKLLSNQQVNNNFKGYA